MKWISEGAWGHILAKVTETDHGTACGLVILGEPSGEVEVKAITERPFAGDTCRTCHIIAKGILTVDPLPGWAVVAGPPVKRRMTAEERAAAIAGEKAAEDTSNSEGAQIAMESGDDPPVVTRGIPDDPDGMGWPEEASGPPSVGDAIFVAPSKSPRRRKIASGAALDDDDGIDS